MSLHIQFTKCCHKSWIAPDIYDSILKANPWWWWAPVRCSPIHVRCAGSGQLGWLGSFVQKYWVLAWTIETCGERLSQCPVARPPRLLRGCCVGAASLVIHHSGNFYSRSMRFLFLSPDDLLSSALEGNYLFLPQLSSQSQFWLFSFFLIFPWCLS